MLTPWADRPMPMYLHMRRKHTLHSSPHLNAPVIIKEHQPPLICSNSAVLLLSQVNFEEYSDNAVDQSLMCVRQR